MSRFTANVSQVVAIAQDDSIVIWGNEQETHFKGIPFKTLKNNCSYASAKIKWGTVIYKPVMVSSCGPATVIIGKALLAGLLF